MSYIDEIYGKQLEEALRGLVSRPALGQPWFGFHASEVPAGVLLFTATTHSRVLYADFWKYIQDKNLVKTEEEWQSIYNEQGWCPFYSDGDGIDTFRMPSAPLYLHGANTLDEAGKYIKEGLPYFGGSLQGVVTDSGYGTGIFNFQQTTLENLSVVASGAKAAGTFTLSPPPIYGNSDTVTPETSKMLFGIWAISAPQKPIPDATAEGIISELEIVSNGLNGVVRSVNGMNVDAKGEVKLSESLFGTYALPSGAYTDITLPAHNTIIYPPEDGWLFFQGTTSTATNLAYGLQGACSSIVRIDAKGVDFATFIPVSKGGKVNVLYEASISKVIFRLYYTRGYTTENGIIYE